MAANRKSSILIVDDSAMVWEYIIDSLTQSDNSGWNFFDADNGRIALEILRREKIDLVLPVIGEDAGQVAEKLRRLVENHLFARIKKKKLTISMGVCT